MGTAGVFCMGHRDEAGVRYGGLVLRQEVGVVRSKLRSRIAKTQKTSGRWFCGVPGGKKDKRHGLTILRIVSGRNVTGGQ